MRFSGQWLSVVLLVFISLACAVFAQQSGRGFDASNLDKTCKPCNDFYQYANGGWLAKNEIPAAFSSWGAFNRLAESNRETLHQILEEASSNTAAAAGSNEGKIGALYASCMDEAKIEAAGLASLTPELRLIDGIKDTGDLPAEIARLHSFGVRALFSFSASQDFKKSTEVIGIARQSGLALPDRDYYIKTDDKSKQLRDAYTKHLAKMFALLGDDPQKSSAAAQTVMTIETKLAESSRDRVQLRDPSKQYNKMEPAQLKTLTPGFNWEAYFKSINAPKIATVNVAHPEFFQAMDKMLGSIPLADWKTYLRWHLVHNTVDALPSKFVNEDFDFFGKTLTGAKELQPRWRRCVVATDTNLGEALGEVYVKKAFTPAAKARMQELVGNLIAVLREDLKTMEWMGDATRKAATAKLEAFGTKIGYPDKWRDYSALKIDRTSAYADNILRAAQFEHRRRLRKIGQRVDRTEWSMTPPTVNAYHSPLMVEIVFPAGILQPPFFNPEADDAVNYGAIGAVIGHELTHGFDDQGRKFDYQGNLAEWWSPDDLQRYQQRATCVEKQFSAFEAEKGLNLNGKLVLGESIADLGGLSIAYAAFQKSLEGKPRPVDIDGFTPEQRFFLGWAQVWGRKYRPEAMRLQVATDPHPLSRFRVNGPVSNMPTFAAAFGCKQGDPMVRPASERCDVW